MPINSNGSCAQSAPVGLLFALSREGGVVPKRWPRERLVQAVGPEAAFAAASTQFAAGARTVVSFGVAGATSPALRAGDLLLPQVVVCDGDEFGVDTSLRMQLHAGLEPIVRVYDGRHAAVQQVVGTRVEKDRLRSTSGACGVDLESGGVAKAAAEHNAAFLVVRAVADDLHADLPQEVARWTNARGGVRPLTLLSDILRRPTILSELPPMARAFNTALKTLACAGNQLERLVYGKPNTGDYSAP